MDVEQLRQEIFEAVQSLIEDRRKKIAKVIAWWIINPISKWAKDNKKHETEIPISPENLNLLAQLEVDGYLSRHQARQLFNIMLDDHRSIPELMKTHDIGHWSEL